MTLKDKLAQLGQEAEKLRAKATDHPSRFTKADSDRATEVAAEHRRIKGMIDQQAAATKALGPMANIPSSEQHILPGEDDIMADLKQSADSRGLNRAALDEASPFGLEVAKAFNEASSVFGGAGSGKAMASRGQITAAIPTRKSIPAYGNGYQNANVSSLVGLPQTGMSLLEVIGAEEVSGPVGGYLRQTLRDNKASTVPAGQVKPTSEYRFDPAQWRMSTIAHLTGPIRTQWLEDYSSLMEFIEHEMAYGIDRAANRFILFGGQDEDGGLQPGLLNTPGLQTVEFDDSKLTTLRNAIGELEDTGVQPTHIVMNSTDWKQIELQREASGAFMFEAAPGGRAGKQLWGLPVITPPDLPAGRSMVGTFEKVRLLHRGSHQIEWNNSAMLYPDPERSQPENQPTEAGGVYDNFARNMVRFRDEMRASLVNQSLHAYKHVLLNEDVSSEPPSIDNPYPDVEPPTGNGTGLVPVPQYPNKDDNGNGDD